MDAHLFRILTGLLAPVLENARVERIFEPLPGIFSFTLFTEGAKKRLLFRPSRSGSLLYLTASPGLPNPPFPTARVMRLRKYAEGRRLGALHADWTRRRAAFPLPGEPGQELWLLLDMKEGPSVTLALPDDFDAPFPQPDKRALEALLAAPEESGPLAPWRDYPTLSPLLRRTLTLLPVEEGEALLMDLEAAEDDLFVYEQPNGVVKLSAWPLPTPLTPKNSTESLAPHTRDQKLELFRAAQEPFLLGEAENVRSRDDVQNHKKAAKKKESLRKRLEAEKERLLALIARKDEARFIQSQLWRFAPDAREASLDRDDPANPGHGSRIPLDPRLTIRENMERIFHQADRATRGLAFLEERLRALAEGRDIQPVSGRAPVGSAPASTGTARAPKGKRPGTQQRRQNPWTEFLSSDDFIMLRGKNAGGNQAILKQARAFDLWFHTEDGPSAHLILRRHHAEHAVPLRTLLEAASLVALKSDAKFDAKVRVICALVKEVSPLKGGSPGAVTVRSILHSLLATPDPELEKTLKN